MEAEDDDRILQEAMRRSLEETTLEETLLADAKAQSLELRSYEIAKELQADQEQLFLEKALRETLTGSPAPNAGEMHQALESSSVNSSKTATGATSMSSRTSASSGARQAPVSRTKNMSGHSPLQSGSSASTVVQAKSPRSRRSPKSPSVSAKQSPKEVSTRHEVARASRSRDANDNASKSSSEDESSKTYAAALSSVPHYRPPSLRTRPSITSAQNSLQTATANQPPTTATKPRVVIDGQNVAYSYGGGKNRFRAKGIEVVLDYYRSMGITAVAMVPRNKVDTRAKICNDRVADDPELLMRLADADLVAFTPAGVHDDHFLLSYAMQKQIDIISNDRFQKEISEQDTPADTRNLQGFLREHLIPYTFVQDDFVPNPNPSQLCRPVHHSRATRR